MLGRCRIVNRVRITLLAVSLVCFLSGQTAWPAEPTAHARCDEMSSETMQAPANGAVPTHRHAGIDHSAMHHDRQPMPSSPAPSQAGHECCHGNAQMIACAETAGLHATHCQSGESCCRLEQDRKVPKPSSSVKPDRIDEAAGALSVKTSAPLRPQRGSAALRIPAPERAVFDLKVDLRI